MRDQLAADLESCLWRHALDPWFPRCVDKTHGGFLCDFDRAWKSNGPHEKQMEFQARQTLLAADASAAYPDAEHLKEAALHGFACLRDVMWDKDFGGWFYRTDRGGKPLQYETKHVHGFAYAITACAAVFEATGNEEALDLAKEAFQWLESFAHDEEHGGYFGYLRRDGRLILDRKDDPSASPVDGVGVPPGFRDSNVHTDMIETLYSLYKVWPDDLVRQRLEELIDLLIEKLMAPDGAVPYVFEADWTPVPHLERYGIGLQASHRLITASRFIGQKERLKEAAQRMVDHAIRTGGLPEGHGVAFAGPAVPPFEVRKHGMIVTERVWWVQFEALRTFLALDLEEGGKGTYGDHFLAHWAYIRRWLLDERKAGVYAQGLDRLSRWDRRRIRLSLNHPAASKGDPQKDGSHEGRALLYCLLHLKSERQP